MTASSAVNLINVGDGATRSSRFPRLDRDTPTSDEMESTRSRWHFTNICPNEDLTERTPPGNCKHLRETNCLCPRVVIVDVMIGIWYVRSFGGVYRDPFVLLTHE